MKKHIGNVLFITSPAPFTHPNTAKIIRMDRFVLIKRKGKDYFDWDGEPQAYFNSVAAEWAIEEETTQAVARKVYQSIKEGDFRFYESDGKNVRCSRSCWCCNHDDPPECPGEPYHSKECYCQEID